MWVFTNANTFKDLNLICDLRLICIQYKDDAQEIDRLKNKIEQVIAFQRKRIRFSRELIAQGQKPRDNCSKWTGLTKLPNWSQTCNEPPCRSWSAWRWFCPDSPGSWCGWFLSAGAWCLPPPCRKNQSGSSASWCAPSASPDSSG